MTAGADARVWRYLYDLNGSTIAIRLPGSDVPEPCERCGIPVIPVEVEWLADGNRRRVWWQFWSQLWQRNDKTGFEHRQRDCDSAKVRRVTPR